MQVLNEKMGEDFVRFNEGLTAKVFHVEAVPSGR